jgi:hypothetical protein
MPASECAAQLYLDGMVQRTKSIELAMPARSPAAAAALQSIVVLQPNMSVKLSTCR